MTEALAMDLPSPDANHPYLDAVNANRGILRIGPAVIRKDFRFLVCGIGNIIQQILKQGRRYYTCYQLPGSELLLMQLLSLRSVSY